MFNKPWELQLYAFRKLKVQYKLHIADKKRSVKENKIQCYLLYFEVYILAYGFQYTAWKWLSDESFLFVEDYRGIYCNNKIHLIHWFLHVVSKESRLAGKL